MFAASTLLKAVGTGIGLLGQFGGASRSQQVADMNYGLTVGNATMRRANQQAAIRVDAIRSRGEMQVARINSRLAMAEAEAQERSAERLRGFAEMQTREGRERVRRMRRGFDELEGRQMRAIASAGVTASGSALDVLADSAEQMAIALADAWDEATYAAGETLDRASMTSFGASQTRIGAQANLMFAKRAHRINKAGAKLARLSAGAEFRSALFGAEIDRMGGYDQAQGQRLAGYGQIFAGAAGFMATRETNRELGIS